MLSSYRKLRLELLQQLRQTRQRQGTILLDGIPQTVKKDIRAVIEATAQVEEQKEDFVAVQPKLSAKEAEKRVRILEKEMRAAAKALEFEKAALLRDEIQKLRDIIGNDANDIDDVNP